MQQLILLTAYSKMKLHKACIPPAKHQVWNTKDDDESSRRFLGLKCSEATGDLSDGYPRHLGRVTAENLPLNQPALHFCKHQSSRSTEGRNSPLWICLLCKNFCFVYGRIFLSLFLNAAPEGEVDIPAPQYLQTFCYPGTSRLWFSCRSNVNVKRALKKWFKDKTLRVLEEQSQKWLCVRCLDGNWQQLESIFVPARKRNPIATGKYPYSFEWPMISNMSLQLPVA